MTLSFARFLPSLSSVRLAALGLALTLVAGFAAAPARAETPAESFVQTNIDKGLKILDNKQISDAQRRSEFRNFLVELTDIRSTALYTLGRWRRGASPQELDAFVDAFRNFAIAVYQTRLSDYSGQTLKITGSRERASGEYVVMTQLVDPDGSSGQQPIEVNFQVYKAPDGFKVRDVSVEGVWLAYNERDQFDAYLKQHNFSVPALTQELQAKAQQMEQGGNNQAGN